MKPQSHAGKRGGARKKSRGGARVRAVVAMVPLIVAVALAAGVTLVGLSVQAEAGGAPAQVTATAELKPVMEVMVTVKLAVAPAVTLEEAGETETVKSGVPEVVPEPVRVTVC